MEKGTLRADANVSVREVGETGYRTHTELKNMNSFNHIARGIEAELRRQIETWESGGEVVQETLDYEVKSDTVTPRRRKEEADDYRYFPEPDLVPVEPEAGVVERLRTEVPELPGTRIRRFEEQYELSHYDAQVLNGSAGLAALYEQVALEGIDAKAASNVLMNDFGATGIDPAAVNGAELAKLIAARSTLPRETFTRALSESADPEFRAETYLGDTLIADTAERSRKQSGPGRRVQGRQGGPARLLRRAGDEGDGRQGRPEGRQRAVAREVGVVSAAYPRVRLGSPLRFS